MKHSLTVIENELVYFFSTDHCQNHGLGPNFVPVTYNWPCRVVERPGVEDGIVDTLDKLKLVFYKDMKEIPNPDPNFQP